MWWLCWDIRHVSDFKLQPEILGIYPQSDAATID
jgi:hypothetical protein